MVSKAKKIIGEKKLSCVIPEDKVFRGLFCLTTVLESGIIDVARPCQRANIFSRFIHKGLLTAIYEIALL